MDAGQQLLQAWTTMLAAGGPFQLTAASAPWLTAPAAFQGPLLFESAAAATAATAAAVAAVTSQQAAPAAGDLLGWALAQAQHRQPAARAAALPAQGRAAKALLAGGGPAGDSASAEQQAATRRAPDSNQLLLIQYNSAQPWTRPLASLLVDGGGEPLGGGGFGQVLQAQYEGCVGGGAQHGGWQVSDVDGRTLFPAPQGGQVVALKRLLPFSELPPERRPSSPAGFRDKMLQGMQREAHVGLCAADPRVARVLGWGFLARGEQACQLLPPDQAAGEQLGAAAKAAAAAARAWWNQVLAAELDIVLMMELYPRGSLDHYVAQLPGGCMDDASAQAATHLMARCLEPVHMVSCIHL
jgi:hypothetical protein